MNTLNPGQDFEELPESYVIFITRDDILGYGLPIYHIDRQIKELEEAFPGQEIALDPLSLSVACHIGYGAVAVACSRRVVVK